MALGTPKPLAEVLPQPPKPGSAWMKTLFFLFNTSVFGVGYLAFDYATEIQPATGTGSAPQGDTWRRFVTHVNNLDTADPADDSEFTVDIANWTSAGWDNSWTSADYTAVGNAMQSFIGIIGTHMSTNYTIVDTDAYAMAFHEYGYTEGDPPRQPPFVKSGPPENKFSWNLVGTGAGSALPPQVASTITEMTPSRRNWGRLYLPGITTANVGTNGRWLTATVDAWAQAYEQMVLALATAGFYVVVPTTTVSGQPARTLQVITGVQCDDVPDVQRRRRYRDPKHVHALP